MPIEPLLRRMAEVGASDLHLKTGSPPGFRVNGDIQPFADMPILTKHDTRGYIEELLTPEQLNVFDEKGDFDLGKQLPGVARFRVNVNRQRGNCGMVIRIIPEKVPTLEDLGAPPVFKTLCELPRGLVLVTGPTGSGKSTTLAAMIDHINRTEAGHILTMEDPIEFVHADKKSFVNQREVGHDTQSFSEALKRALRQDPDVILVGEMRDLETISLAITAAETGHLVFATLHTTSAMQTIDRVVDVFPHEGQQQVRMQLSTTIAGVISQTLVPKVGGGRVAVHEVLIGVDGVRALIREGKSHMLLNMLQTGSAVGMATLEQGMADAVKRGLVTYENGLARVNSQTGFRSLMGMNEGDGGGARSTQAASRAAAPAPSSAPARPAPAPGPAISSARPTGPVPGGMMAPPASAQPAKADGFEEFRRSLTTKLKP